MNKLKEIKIDSSSNVYLLYKYIDRDSTKCGISENKLEVFKPFECKRLIFFKDGFTLVFRNSEIKLKGIKEDHEEIILAMAERIGFNPLQVAEHFSTIVLNKN